ncbi:MAG: hypothetical protein QOF02_989, partial [Blastocatellia bacterium]|nr:hypothetical protein [Blastocatellia bacterium]
MSIPQAVVSNDRLRFHSSYFKLRLSFFSLIALLLFSGLTGTTRAATLTVAAGGDLQSAINAAQPGDTILLEAGATFRGPFTLPNKGTSTALITIRTSTPDASLPAAGERISPAYSALLPKLLAPGGGAAAIQTAAAAHHYRLVGLEFRSIDSSALVYDLVRLGDGSSAQSSLDQVPHHLTVDRCLLTAYPMQGLKRGLALHSAETTVTGCYISGFKMEGQDSQAIGGWNGPGPFHILNNYLEAAGENLMFGGATPSIPGLVPADIEVRRNYLFKPLSWRQGE